MAKAMVARRLLIACPIRFVLIVSRSVGSPEYGQLDRAHASQSGRLFSIVLSVILAAYIAGRLYHDRTDSFCNDAFLVMVQARPNPLRVGKSSGLSRSMPTRPIRLAAAQSLRALLNPRAVAVVGVSQRAEGVGAALLANLRRAGFPGPLYPIHPHAAEIAGLPAFPNVSTVGAPVDLALIAVPAAAVEAVVGVDSPGPGQSTSVSSAPTHARPG